MWHLLEVGGDVRAVADVVGVVEDDVDDVLDLAIRRELARRGSRRRALSTAGRDGGRRRNGTDDENDGERRQQQPWSLHGCAPPLVWLRSPAARPIPSYAQSRTWVAARWRFG